MNYYEIIGVSRKASHEEIAKSFRRLAKKYHPDINKEYDAKENFIKVLEAYEILKEPYKRKVYDELLNKSKYNKDNTFGLYTTEENNFNEWKTAARKEGEYYSERTYKDIEKYWDYYDHGYELYVKKQYREAIECFNKLLGFKKNKAAFFFRGCAYQDTGNYNLAISDFTNAISMEPNNSVFLYFRGTVYIELNNDAMAFKDFSRCIEIDNYPHAYKGRGNIYLRKGKIDLAIQDYQNGIRMAPKNARIYFNLAVAYDYKKNTDKAIFNYTLAIQFDNKMHEAYINRGNVYYAKSEYDKAIPDFTKAISLGNDMAYFNRGNAYYLTQRYDEAINDYTETIRINPNDSMAYNNRGAAYKAKGNFTKSKLDFSKARVLEEK